MTSVILFYHTKEDENMTRQYIGARYVPRFLGEYSATTIYEALDVVDDGMGTSYIAKKTVPAGTPLNNTDYWFVYGASSGAILDLQNRMGVVEGDIAEIMGDKYIFIGDSYALPSYYSTDNWIDTMISDLGLSASNCYIARMGAVGFLNLQNPDDNFLTLLQSISMSSADAAQVKHIIVCGGANDASGTINNIVGAIQAFISYAKTNYPNATIHIGCIGRAAVNSSDVKCLQVAAPAYEKGCRYGAHYIKNSQYIFNNKNNYLTGDTIHPSAPQCKEIGHALAAGFETGCDVHAVYHPTLSVAGHVESLENFDNIEEVVTNNMITLHFGGRYNTECAIKFDSLQTMNSQGMLFSIADLTGDNALLRGGVPDTGVTVQCWYRGDTGSANPNVPIRSGTCWIGISNNRLYLTPYLDVDPGSFGEAMSVKEIYLTGFAFNFDINAF